VDGDGDLLGADNDTKTHRHEMISIAVSTNVPGFQTQVFDVITHGENFAGLAMEYLYQIARRGYRVQHHREMWLW